MDYISLLDQLYRQGWSQADVRRYLKSHEVNVSQSTLSKIERGDTKDPRSSIGNAISVLHYRVCIENQQSA